MNLLENAWLPVRRHDGSGDWIAPHQLSDPTLAAFDACRPDFNGALAQFAIGLLQTCAPVEGRSAWSTGLTAPPDATTLRGWFDPVRSAFEFDGDGPCFMQDFELRDGDPIGIGSLLIDSPGENALRNNSDHFVKRGRVEALCPACAALALFTLQLNAPSGGAGHRTGLRGGGPLTTLLRAGGNGTPLWTQLWLNVSPRDRWLAGGVPTGKDALNFRFPWLAPQTAQQPPDGQTTPEQTHPDQVFWAMPRRIRLDMEDLSAGACDLCGCESVQRIQRYITRNYGLNYKGNWRHPLSPYYETKEGMLPLHPQPDGLGWRHWAGWVLGLHSDQKRIEPAAALTGNLGRLERSLGLQMQLWAFGFDMDNMKARCWYDSTLPLYHLADLSSTDQRALRDEVGAWVAGTHQAARYLAQAVKNAWFSADARGDFSFVDAAFWSLTERAFYRLLPQAINAPALDQQQPRAEELLKELARAALALFDHDLVGTGPVGQVNPARVARAHKRLRNQLGGDELRRLLLLPVKAAPANLSKANKAGKAASSTP
jgi:CRISPR system Cascade subunit CasA